MAENFESYEDADAVGGKESTGESDEQFRDRYRKTQAAIKKIKQQEGKKKRQDNTLAHIIVQFLSDPRFTRFFLLIAKLVDKNVPSDLILAILALIHKDSADAIDEKKLEIPKNMASGKNSLFPPELKDQISHWTNNIAGVSMAEPHRVLETIVDHDWNLNLNISELCAAVLQQFLVIQKTEVPPVDNLRGFAKGFFETLVGKLEQQVHHQGALAGDIDEDFEH